MTKRSIALIVGSGFSREAGLPTTKDLSREFLRPSCEDFSSPEYERAITRILEDFWQDIFGYKAGKDVPSLEDHFTVLDLAANSGHHLGPKYNPRKLRAIRRMSIHRVFRILDERYQESAMIKRLFQTLGHSFDVSVISLNWDIVIEKHLDFKVRYGLNIFPLSGPIETPDGALLLKVHGSSSWVYCDSCRRLYGGTDKMALHRRAYLEDDDFQLFGDPRSTASLDQQTRVDRRCPHCGNLMAGRVATFSYRKALSVSQLQTLWEAAHEVLSRTDLWLFAGYSLPEADFEFRHLLKSAQLGRHNLSSWVGEVILKSDREAAKRYRRLFGVRIAHVCQDGLEGWAGCRLDQFCQEHG